MGEGSFTRATSPAAGSAPLFILSFRHRDELTRIAEAAEWRPVAARRTSNAEARFIASGAAVAVVDARGAPEEGHDGVRRLSDAVETNAAALLVICDAPEELDRLYAAGATHFLLSPFSDEQFASALRFAARHVQRLGGSRLERRAAGDVGASWRWEPGSNSVALSSALARQAGLGGEGEKRLSLMELFRRLDPEGRRAARAAVDRLMASGEPTAFAHGGGEGADLRLAHRLRVDASGHSVLGLTETIGPARAVSRDALTGLRDAPAARAWIAERLLTGTSHEPAMVALLLAVSRFDAINAAFGRGTGDAVLQSAARRIERLLDANGQRRLVARLAGAEFGIFLAAPTSLSEARFLAGQLADAIGRPFISGDHVITLGCRIGVAASEGDDDAAALLRRASSALSEAKVAETGQVRIFDAGGLGRAAYRDRLEVDLRKALDRDEIDILFQPQVAVTTGAIVGAEALARWRHPEYGELGAITLFNVAERSDYLAQLSDHVQRKAIAAAAGWPEALAGLRLAVNITAADIGRANFADSFVRMVDSSGFDPERLTVEVTEGELIEDLGAAAALLAQLRERSLRVAIDDFGTGYSSLAYLKALPLDYLKIDKRLCEDITGSPRDRIVVRSVIEMARSLGLAVIAEGVETEEQLSLLAQEGCNFYQGFLCSEPVDSATLAQLVSR